MKPSLRYGIFCLISTILGSCESVPDKMRVVEKSRQIQPQWLEAGPGLMVGPDGIDFVICKDRILDLTLGLEQTQASVLYNLKFQIFQMLRKPINLAALSPTSARDFNQVISKTLDKELTPANLEDFYFDKVNLPRADTGLIPEYYRVFAHAHVDNAKATGIKAAIKAFVQNYPQEDLRSQLPLLQ